MSDWENEDEDVQVAIPVPSAANRWDDEDAEEEDVKDSWEDDEEELKKKKKKEEEERLKKEAEAKKAAAAPKKKTLAQTLKEKEEDEKRKRLAKAAELAISNETEAEKRERERREIVQADFENAKELFSSIAPSPNVPSDSVLETLKPSNRAEFDAYNKELQTKFTSFEKSAHYAYFAENVVRDMCVSLSVDDLKKVAALLNAMASEKLKAQKEKDKKGKKGGKAKVSLKATPGGIDTTNYDDGEWQKHMGRLIARSMGQAARDEVAFDGSHFGWVGLGSASGRPRAGLGGSSKQAQPKQHITTQR